MPVSAKVEWWKEREYMYWNADVIRSLTQSLVVLI